MSYRVKVVIDPDGQFEEANGEKRPLTEAEYAEYAYKDTSYTEYLTYYGNPDRHVYLGVIVETQCESCSSWHSAGSLWRIDVMDDTEEANFPKIECGPCDVSELPGYLRQVTNELIQEYERKKGGALS